MFQAQASEYKYEIERLTTELADTKKNYYETKRRVSLTREVKLRPRLLDNSFENTQNLTLPNLMTIMPRTTRHNRQHSHRFTGGGFPLLMN